MTIQVPNLSCTSSARLQDFPFRPSITIQHSSVRSNSLRMSSHVPRALPADQPCRAKRQGSFNSPTFIVKFTTVKVASAPVLRSSRHRSRLHWELACQVASIFSVDLAQYPKHLEHACTLLGGTLPNSWFGVTIPPTTVNNHHLSSTTCINPHQPSSTPGSDGLRAGHEVVVLHTSPCKAEKANHVAWHLVTSSILAPSSTARSP